MEKKVIGKSKKRKWLEEHYQYPKSTEIKETLKIIKETKEPPDKEKLSRLMKALWGNNIMSYQSHPITDKQFISVLKGRAEGFEVGDSELPFQLQEDSIYDLGSISTNTSNILSMIDIKKSAKLAKIIKKNTGFEADPKNVAASFLSEQMFPAYLPDTIFHLY